MQDKIDQVIRKRDLYVRKNKDANQLLDVLRDVLAYPTEEDRLQAKQNETDLKELAIKQKEGLRKSHLWIFPKQTDSVSDKQHRPHESNIFSHPGMKFKSSKKNFTIILSPKF